MEAAAYGDLLPVGNVGRLQGSENWGKIGWAGLLDERDDDQVASADVGLVLVEGVELLAVAAIERSGCKDQQDTVAIDEGGERLLSRKHRRGDHKGEESDAEE